MARQLPWLGRALILQHSHGLQSLAGGSAHARPALLRSFATAAASKPEEREQLQFDVCIVGAGPAGLAAAIRVKQLCKEMDRDLSVCVLEKASAIGAHTISGCVLEPRALDELLPEWKNDPTCPIKVPAGHETFLYLFNSQSSVRLPLPKTMKNKGNYIVSLSEVVRWMGDKATELGVDILPGFPARSLIYDGHNGVCGVTTQDQGINKQGERKPTFQPGTDILSKVTLLAEGARGSLSKEAIARYNLADKGLHEESGADKQSYALGVKEVWEVPESIHKQGQIVHTVGYPLDQSTYGGGFIYHMDKGRVSLGFVTGLDYSNPYLSPFQEFQRWKLHPAVRKHIEGGTCVQYGARTLTEGGFQCIPKLTFPGGALVGCAAGFLNVPKIKGTHTAMLSGMAAGEAAFRALNPDTAAAAAAAVSALAGSAAAASSAATAASSAAGSGDKPVSMEMYENAFKVSWAHEELKQVRNVRPGFRFGLLPGLLHAAIDQYILRGKAWWTLRWTKPDHKHLRPAKECQPIDYPKPDGKLTFDIPTSLYRSGTNHDHDQPPHLVLKDKGVPEYLNGPHYAAPESKYCPAGVYEYSQDEHGRTRLTINAQNCLHCKACDVKDPTQNITWTVPEGGGGPNYSMT